MDDCDVCYQITCKSCGWTATNRDVLLIQAGYMRECPDCGWIPGEKVEDEAEIVI